MSRGDWQRVSRRRPCPVCERPDWCLFAGDESAPSAAICARIESDKRVGDHGAGWLHILRHDGPTWPHWKRTVQVAARQVGPEPSAAPAVDFGDLAARALASTDDAQRERFAAALGVSAASLRRLGAGWLPDRRAWAFPMRDARGRVLGIRLRYRNGRKLSIKGSKEGLFLPGDLHGGGRLLVCEGPTDSAALVDLGFDAVGRPSCSGGAKHIVALVKRLGPSEVVIVADGDQPGQRGADRLAAALLVYVPVVRVVTPPDGIKDARAWKRAGATAADVHLAIQAAAVQTVKVNVRTH